MNITNDTDDELSLRVDEDKGFLFLTRDSANLLLESIKEVYIYTDIQLEVFKDDIEYLLKSME